MSSSQSFVEILEDRKRNDSVAYKTLRYLKIKPHSHPTGRFIFDTRTDDRVPGMKINAVMGAISLTQTKDRSWCVEVSFVQRQVQGLWAMVVTTETKTAPVMSKQVTFGPWSQKALSDLEIT